jgi:reactive intermediate/imine deaminase
MTKRSISTANAPKPAGPYSQGIISGEFLFTAGIVPRDPDTGAITGGIAEQSRRVLLNLEAVLREAMVSFDDVVKATVHLANLDRDFAEFNQVYAEFFNQPYPVRTCVGSILNGVLVEIDIVAKLPDIR